MSADAAKQRLQAAERHLQKGSRKRAVAELKKVLKKDPENIRALTRLGDVYAEGGDMVAAREAYVKVGDFYRREGYLLKAISMYKALTERFPDDPHLLVALGDLFRQMGLFSDAVIRYRTAIDIYDRRQDVADKLSVVQKVLDLSPDNVVDRVRLAESYVRLEAMDEAVEQLRLAASELFRRGEQQAFIQVGERLLFFRSDDLETNRRLAEVYTKRKEYLKALEKLQISHELAPGDRAVLEMIARTFAELGEKEKAAFVVKELVRLAEQDNLLPEKERYQRQLKRLGVGEEQKVDQIGLLREGEEVEFDDFGDVTVLEAINQRDFPEIPVDDGEEIEVFEEADLIDDDDIDSFEAEEPSDETEFDVGELEETIVADTDFASFDLDPALLAAARGEIPTDSAPEKVSSLAQEPPPETDAFFDEDEEPSEPEADLDEFVDASPSGTVDIAAAAERALPDSVEEDLKEIDFYMQNGLVSEAHEVLEELLHQYPNAKRLLEKKRELEAAG